MYIVIEFVPPPYWSKVSRHIRLVCSPLQAPKRMWMAACVGRPHKKNLNRRYLACDQVLDLGGQFAALLAQREEVMQQQGGKEAGGRGSDVEGQRCTHNERQRRGEI
jgi:hypothetical protein